MQNCCKNHSQIPKNSKKTKNCFSYFRPIQSLRVIPIHCWRCKEPIAIKFACQSSRNLHKQFYGLKLFSIIAYHYSCIFNLFCGLLCVHRTHTKLLVWLNCIMAPWNENYHGRILGFQSFQFGGFQHRKNWTFSRIWLNSSRPDELNPTLAPYLYSL